MNEINEFIAHRPGLQRIL